MRLRLISALIAVSALAACATQAPMPAAGSAATASAPTPMPGYDWFLNTDGQEAMLAYGVANSDEVKLKLACQAGSSALELTASSDKPGREIYLESGGDTERYRAALAKVDALAPATTTPPRRRKKRCLACRTSCWRTGTRT